MVLRGRAGQKNLTRLAQPYPSELCTALAYEVTLACGFSAERLTPLLDPPRAPVWDATLGYPGEGPAFWRLYFWLVMLNCNVFHSGAGRGGPHGALKQGARQLAATQHTAEVTKLRVRWRDHLYWWLRQRGCEPNFALASVTHAVPLMREFVQESFDEGKLSLKSVKLAIQGACDYHWHLQGALRPVWKLLRSWEKGEPLDLRTPVSKDVFAAMTWTCLGWGW